MLGLQLQAASFMPSMQASEALLLESFTSRSDAAACTTALSCSPPRSANVRRPQSITIVTVTPSKSFLGTRRRGKRRRPTSMGDSDGPGDNGGQGGNWDGGSGNWDDEDQPPYNIKSLWVWQLICICSVLQAVQHWLSPPRPEQHQQGVDKATLAIA